MRSRRLSNWRFALYLLLFTLILTPATSSSVRASPDDPGTAPVKVAAVGDNLITNISLGPDTPNILQNN